MKQRLENMLHLSSSLPRRKRVGLLFGLLSTICLLLTISTLCSHGTWLQIHRFSQVSHQNSLHRPSSTTTAYKGTSKNIAAIVEDRPLERLIPLLLHFSNVLGSDWPIVIFTSQDLIPTLAPFKHAMDESRIIVKFLPAGVQASTRHEYSRILTTSWIWEQLARAENVFLFHADSIICANSPHTINDFLEYDFIAAPYDRWVGEDKSDGLSLRNRTMTLDIVKAVNFGDLTQPTNPQFDVVDSEEQWLYQQMKDLTGPRHGGSIPRLPSKEVAIKFSVGKMWHARAFGYQGLANLSSAQKKEMDVWCPEYRLAIESLPF